MNSVVAITNTTLVQSNYYDNLVISMVMVLEIMMEITMDSHMKNSQQVQELS